MIKNIRILYSTTMFTPELLFKLSIFGFLWSQAINLTGIIQKIISNEIVSGWIAFTGIFIIIHIIDVYSEKFSKKNY